MKKIVQAIELPKGENTVVKTEKPIDFDGILREIGEFGLYQILVGLLIGLVGAFSTFLLVSFVFTADIPEHRCFVPECEQIGSNDFNAEWVKYAIPHINGKLVSCSRYAYVAPMDPTHGGCSATNFNQSNVITCDTFITKNNEDTLATHLNMLCTGQDNKLALLGTASTIGRTVATPVSGILADKFGRLNLFIVSSVLVALFSTLQALPASIMSFELYWTFELLAALISTGATGSSIVFNMEWVTPKYRLHMNNISSIMRNTVLFIALSLAAWYFADNFVAFRLVLGVPGFVAILLYLIFGESPKWLFTQNKYDQAIKSISKAAKMNGKPIKPHIIQQIEDSSTFASKESALDEQSIHVTFVDLMKRPMLAFRLCVTSVVSLLIMFAYFGLMFGSAKAHSNKYLSLLIVGLAEIPGNILNTCLMNRIGRKITLSGTSIIYAVLLLASTQVPVDGVYRLTLFFLGKTAIACTITGFHIYASELWPTSIRGTAYSICTMIGRFGSILATVTVLLVEYHEHFPVFLYASAAILGAVLLLVFLPETCHCEKLPDTIEEALAIGNDRKRKGQPEYGME